MKFRDAEMGRHAHFQIQAHHIDSLCLKPEVAGRSSLPLRRSLAEASFSCSCMGRDFLPILSRLSLPFGQDDPLDYLATILCR